MTTGRKLAIGGTLIACVTAYMAYLGAATSWQYYLTVDECLAEANDLVGLPIRVNGKIAGGSLSVSPAASEARFQLAGSGTSLLPVFCTASLPDNLAEGRDVVVEGRLDSSKQLRASNVLTRCASKYESGGSGHDSAQDGPRGGS